jgi:hypothetical protein
MMDDHPLLGIELFERAVDFREAYRALPSTHGPPNWPRYFLFCHAIELVLKAYIARADREITIKKLKDVGHDLTKAYNKAIALGLRPMPALAPAPAGALVLRCQRQGHLPVPC